MTLKMGEGLLPSIYYCYGIIITVRKFLRI